MFKVQHATFNIDDLCSDFSRLRISDTLSEEHSEGHMPKLWGESRPRKLTGCDVTAHYTVRPFRAPLMDFIRNPMSHRSGPRPFRPCNKLSHSLSGLEGSLFCSSNGVTPSPDCTKPMQKSFQPQRTCPVDKDCSGEPSAKGQRKKPRLPRRGPANRPTRQTACIVNAKTGPAVELQTEGSSYPQRFRASVDRSASFSSVDSLTSDETCSPSTPILNPPKSYIGNNPSLPPSLPQGDILDSCLSTYFDFTANPLSEQSFDQSTKSIAKENTFHYAFPETFFDPLSSLAPPDSVISNPFSFPLDFTPLLI